MQVQIALGGKLIKAEVATTGENAGVITIPAEVLAKAAKRAAREESLARVFANVRYSLPTTDATDVATLEHWTSKGLFLTTDEGKIRYASKAAFSAYQSTYPAIFEAAKLIKEAAKVVADEEAIAKFTETMDEEFHALLTEQEQQNEE